MNHSNARPHISCDSDQAALMGYLASRTALLKEVSQIVLRITAWQDVAITPDRNGLCLTLRGLKLGYLHWNGRIDVALGSELRDELVAQKMAKSHPEEPDAGVVVFDVRGGASVDRAIWLLRLAYLDLTPTTGACPPRRAAGRPA